MSSEYAVRSRVARKFHWCSMDYAHDRHIKPGDTYYIYTDFPSSDLGYASYAKHPVKWKLCAQCWRDT